MKSIRFNENLRELRTSKKITQKQLADILQVDQRTISAWEKGICEPSFSMLLKLCDFFDETFDNILT
ncbi:MAG: helix-turn-helix transcriptional regulator [Clostridia bacterium]|nr:helix-turn-helix transcriptional regulator [Clostridia bacterium]